MVEMNKFKKVSQQYVSDKKNESSQNQVIVSILSFS